MAQQSEIEEALDKLAMEDPHFGKLLEEEYQRTEEDQFVGLFVKNLENVQGDERDIIIMSICYGFNNKGKMFMNFGPINRRGGEKRLNVIFSRAKRNMIVVSSILAINIKNDYNEGANYFKKFLAYAKSISDGHLDTANGILNNLHKDEDEDERIKRLPIINQLKAAMEKEDYIVDTAIGQSHFKCDLALRKGNSESYELAILIDRSIHYSTDNILKQYSQKPAVLKAFGWKIQQVYSKDWLEQPERVLQKIRQKLAGIEEPELELEAEVETEKEDEVEGNTVIESEIFSTPEEKVKTEIATVGKPADNSSLSFKRYEYKEGSSNKYWEIAVDGIDLITRYGRIGNKPQENKKSFTDNSQALREQVRLIGVKIRKGYRAV